MLVSAYDVRKLLLERTLEWLIKLVTLALVVVRVSLLVRSRRLVPGNRRMLLMLISALTVVLVLMSAR